MNNLTQQLFRLSMIYASEVSLFFIPFFPEYVCATNVSRPEADSIIEL